jgi:hypothetical protein
MSEVFDQRAALYDYVLKSQLAGARRVANALRSGWRGLPIARE